MVLPICNGVVMRVARSPSGAAVGAVSREEARAFTIRHCEEILRTVGIDGDAAFGLKARQLADVHRSVGKKTILDVVYCDDDRKSARGVVGMATDYLVALGRASRRQNDTATDVCTVLVAPIDSGYEVVGRQGRIRGSKCGDNLSEGLVEEGLEGLGEHFKVSPRDFGDEAAEEQAQWFADGWKVLGKRHADHIGVAAFFNANALADVSVAASEIGGVDQRRSVGRKLRHESVVL